MNYVWRRLLLDILIVKNVIGQCFHVVTICNSVFLLNIKPASDYSNGNGKDDAYYGFIN